MYNRYIPQPDGSYQRKQVQDIDHKPVQEAQLQKPSECPPLPNEQPADAPQNEIKKPPCAHMRPPRRYSPQAQQHNKPEPSRDSTTVGQFLRQLVPKDFDTGDLLIVLLLLLMAGDNTDDSNSALLTLALYLFM